MERHQFRSSVFAGVSVLVAAAAFALDRLNPNELHLPCDELIEMLKRR